VADDALNYHDESIRAFARWQFGLWIMLRSVLEDRPGWHFEVDHDGQPFWRFGIEGAARLVITVQYDKFLIHDADNDKEQPMVHNDETLVWWLNKHEPEHAGPTDAQVYLGGEILTSQAEEFLRDPDERGPDDQP
jgi:hypothetical protein